MSNISGNKRIAKNSVFLYIRLAFVLLVSLYTTRVILKVLGVVDYGVFNVVGGFVSMFGFLNTSLVGAIQRYYNFEYSLNGGEGLKKVYTTSLIIQAVLSIIIVILLETFGLWYVNKILVVPPERMVAANFLFQTSILSMVIVIMQIPYSAAVVSFEKMDYYAFVGIIEVLLKLATVVVLPFINYDQLITYGAILLFITIIDFFLYFIYAKRKFENLQIVKPFQKDLFRSMLAFSGWNFFGTFAGLMMTQGLNMLLNFFFGPVVNAARGIASQIKAALQSFSLNLVQAFRPQLVDSYAKEDYKRTQNIMFVESKVCFALIATFLAPLLLELKFVLNLWLGNNFPEYTIEFTALILITMLVSTLNTPMSQVVHATGKMKIYQVVTSFITCSVIPISWGILKLGCSPISVFLAGLGVTIINQISSVFIVKKIFPYSIKNYLESVIVPCVIFLFILPVVPFIITRLMADGWTRFIVNCIITLIIDIPLVYFIILNKGEQQFAEHILKEKLFKNIINR